MIKYSMSLCTCSESKKAFFENLGIERIIPFLQKNGYKIEYEYLFRDMEPIELKKVLKKDIVGFSLYPDTFEFSYECIKCVKDYGGYVIVGGKYATDNYEELLNNIPEIDAICLGHGEFPYLELLNMLSGGINIEQCFGEIPFFATRNKRIDQIKICVSDINDLCIPDRTKYFQLTKVEEVFICDSHGCSGNCTFCSNCQNMRRYSTRSAEDIVQEIRDINRRYGIKQFNLIGNSFEDPGDKGKEKISKFCDLLLELGLNINVGCYIKGDFIKRERDKWLLDRMVSSGFTHIFIGVEAANNDDLLLYGKRATLKDTKILLDYLKRYDDRTMVSCGFIMLNPFSTLERLKSNYLFLADNHTYTLSNYISRLYIYPETKMYSICKKEGVLTEGFDSRHPLNYKVIDNDVRLIYEYVAEELIPFQNSLPNMIDVVRNIYGIRKLLGNIDAETDKSFFRVLSEVSELLKVFFSYLFVINDVERCRKVFPVWSKKMIEKYKMINAINMKYMVAYVREKNRKGGK